MAMHRATDRLASGQLGVGVQHEHALRWRRASQVHGLDLEACRDAEEEEAKKFTHEICIEETAHMRYT